MLFSEYLTESELTKRFHEKICSGKAVGSDGISANSFEANLDVEIDVIQRKVENLTYRFSLFKEKLILKNKNSPPRAVYIPTVRDRLLLNVLNAYLNEQFKDDLASFNKPVQHTVSEVKKIIASQRFDGFLKLDVKNFFPSLDHEILLKKLKTRIDDKQALSLLKKVLNRSESGIAQGLSISSVLASIYLNALDQQYKQKTNLKYFRFVDDILILCNVDEAKSIEAEITQEMSALKLDLHGEKSEIGLLNENGLSYLGYVFNPTNISVRESSVERLRKRIRQQFSDILADCPLHEDECLEELYRRLNLKITGCLYDGKPYGWLFFFSQIDDLNLLYHLDWFVHKTFQSFSVEYDPERIKSFVKAYYKIKTLNPNKLDPESYIPSFEATQEKTKDIKSKKAKSTSKSALTDLQALLIELEEDVEIYF